MFCFDNFWKLRDLFNTKLIANFITRFYSVHLNIRSTYTVLEQINVAMTLTIFYYLCYFQKKKAKKDPLAGRKAKNDPNAPPLNRIPLPELWVFVHCLLITISQIREMQLIFIDITLYLLVSISLFFLICTSIMHRKTNVMFYPS